MYFDAFPKKKNTPGIPGVKMNAPISPSVVYGEVGIEFEIEATNSLPVHTKDYNKGIAPDPVTGGIWTIKEDHSLRNGYEYVTTTAVTADHAQDLFAGLFQNFSDYKTNLRFSNRCSTHVHLNISGWKINKLISFIALWALFEEPLIDFCGPKRKTNHFCLGINDSLETINAVTSYLRTGIWNMPDGLKYSAMNLLRMFDIGTIEIRCGDAFEDPALAAEWVRLLWAIRMHADSIENPSTIPARISGDSPRFLFEQLCSSARAPRIYDRVLERYGHSFDSACYKTFREVLHLCYFPWDDWLPEINREYVTNPFAKKGFPRVRAAGRGLRFEDVGLQGENLPAPPPARPIWDN